MTDQRGVDVMKVMDRAAVLALALLLAGCANGGVEQEHERSAPVPGEIANVSGHGGSVGVYRVRDKDNGVICYVAVGYKKAGIDCMKLTVTAAKGDASNG